MEHRERHCPSPNPRCLVPLPAGYKIPTPWPQSRDLVRLIVWRIWQLFGRSEVVAKLLVKDNIFPEKDHGDRFQAYLSEWHGYNSPHQHVSHSTPCYIVKKRVKALGKFFGLSFLFLHVGLLSSANVTIHEAQIELVENEAGNVHYVVENGFRKYSKSQKDIASILYKWFGPKVDELKMMSHNALRFARPDAVFKIVHDLYQLVKERSSLPKYSCAT